MYITKDQTVALWHHLGPSHFHVCHPAGCAHGRGQIFESKTTQQPTKTTMFQGRGMGRLGGRESAASIPSPCHIITSCCTRVGCLSSVGLFVWLVVALSLCPLSSSIPIPSHCHATSLLRLISCPRLIVVKPLRCRVLSRLFPPFSLHDVNVNALPCSSSMA